MVRQSKANKAHIIDKVKQHTKAELKQKEATLCVVFVEQFLSTVSLEDLSEWNTHDLSEALIHMWGTIQKRKAKKPNIKIYNPLSENDGWESAYTVLEVAADDEPFLVDTLRLTINRLGFTSHLIMHIGGLRIERGKQHGVSGIYPRVGESRPDVIVEAVVLMQLEKVTDEDKLKQLKTELERVFKDNRAVVDDWAMMRERVRESIDELEFAPKSLDAFEVEETQLFLKWIEGHHFTFLGTRDYKLVKEGKEMVLKALPETGLGVLRKSFVKSNKRSLADMTPEARELTLSKRILVMSKTNTLATVHRDTYTDYIGIKRFNQKGQVIGERRILGLYTSAAYNTNPKHIPFLRHKVACVMQKSMLNPRGHSGKVLLNILETMPRDDLIQASEDELLEMSMGIFHMQERKRIRLFARMDIYRRFVSCLVYIPRDRFNTSLRQEMQGVLSETFHTENIMFATRFSESVLARIHFIVRLNRGDENKYDFKALEAKLIEVGRSWSDDLQSALYDAFDDESANALFAKYKDAFPASYTNRFEGKCAIEDIAHLEALADDNSLGIHFYEHPEAIESERYRLKLYQHEFTLVLSDVLPILECLGMRAISERPYMIELPDGKQAWISEFVMQHSGDELLDVKAVAQCFKDAFRRVWFDEAENDGFNRLILASALNWRQVAMLRTYAKYFKQVGSAFGQDFIERTLVRHPDIVMQLVELFDTRFRPGGIADRGRKVGAIKRKLNTMLANVSNLDEDKVLRKFIQAIMHTLRTNFYQIDEDGKPKTYISIKVDSKSIPGMPEPYPMFEIFVYAPAFEGVHLRCAKVARGGLRWSDRTEDFRTEILGLMKAQEVKNAVIVPSGAKGGFVPKRLYECKTREEVQNEGVRCYKQFIQALLEITDNYHEDTLIKPTNVVTYDEDDPYLVVAADKGTATFSDIANAIAEEQGFWLGDAFASGGSVGYDHKKMGITARGAWESVKRHFYELGTDIQKTDFTVVGVGDMAGDVFGNGMLLSKCIKLVAAFNHMHIFIDPNPDTAKSFAERKRLFNLSRSSWEDYNQKLISKGGGIFKRSDKSVPVSKEMKYLFDIKQNEIEPNELIRAILRANVDLFWSGGIGTFVKASTESNFEVGDRTNDAIRVDANELRVKVIGEGGNLGLTQLARVQYAMEGGLIYTDFIDNSAGVNCSDKEVNLKILLNQLVKSKKLSVKKRNTLLADMTDEVADLVLRDNVLQTKAISLFAYQAPRQMDLNNRYINTLEQEGLIDRELESLPNKKELSERKLAGKGLSRPELSVLICYSKIYLKEAILQSDIPEDGYLVPYLMRSVPGPVQTRFPAAVKTHPLKREIIATRLSNIIVNEMGHSFVYRMQDETGAPISAIVRAYIITRNVFNMGCIWSEIEALDGKVKSVHQFEVMVSCIRLLRRTTRWFLRFKRMHLDMATMINRYEKGVFFLKTHLHNFLTDEQKKIYRKHKTHYEALGVPKVLAEEITANRTLFFAMDMVEVAEKAKVSIEKVGKLYFELGERLDLTWVRAQLVEHPTENHWEALSREALRDDIDWQQRKLTEALLNVNVNDWEAKYIELITRWRKMIGSLRSSNVLSYTMFFVAIRDLLDLTETTLQMGAGGKRGG